MELIPQKIATYVENHSAQEPELLRQLNKETWQKVLHPRMISGAYQGRVLSMLSKLVNPKTILEIGTFTGYSALCLAEGLQENGQLFTIDKNEELDDFAKTYFEKSAYHSQITKLTGNAMELIPTLDITFDLVFLDADKQNYCRYFELIINKMNKGGVIISDNVLWYGKVAEPVNEKDKDTKELVKYNQLLASDPRLETIMLPIRDGVTVSRVI
ncbi:MAG: class I SAM-dependent methyltransferase [Flavobacteriaceae bacterium]|nr:class I SAM-dependent methyltransferase [Flavobacteriaceae bacterium]